MKTLNFFIIFLLIIFSTSVVKSQVFTGVGIRYSIGAETGLAVGYLAKKYEAPVGISLQADFPVIDGELFATVNSGFNNVFVRPNYRDLVDDLRLVPIKAGLKYFYRSNLYVQSEIGVSFLLNKTECVEGRNVALVTAPQIGMIFYLHEKNYIDAGLRFENTGKFYECDNQNNFIGFRIAWAFTM